MSVGPREGAVKAAEPSSSQWCPGPGQKAKDTN